MNELQTTERKNMIRNSGCDWLSKLSLRNGLTIFDHQIDAINFSLNRKSSYLGLDPGLGKAVCAALLSMLVGPPILVITPPFLVENLTAEFLKWAPQLRVAIVTKKPINLGETEILLLPDSLLCRPEIYDLILEFLRCWGECESTLIVDEAHRFKNEKSQRTKALLDKIALLFDKKTFMSGTPMPNRPMELFPILSRFAPQTINHMNFFEFGKKYCAGFKNRFGWDFRGASNLKELGRRVIHPSGDFMLRIKKNALKLPPKIEEIFIVSSNMNPQLASMERSLGKRYESAEDLMRDAIGARVKGEGDEELHLMTYRRMLAMEKVKPTAEYIDAILSETDESLLVFGLHIEAIEALERATARHKPFVITGKTPGNKRQKLVDEFQSCGNKRRLFMGNINAMGIGLTLTKATRVIFMEFSWVPGDNDQASDRAHRIGQRDTVFVQYVVYKDSIDKKVIETILTKRKSMRFI